MKVVTEFMAGQGTAMYVARCVRTFQRVCCRRVVTLKVDSRFLWNVSTHFYYYTAVPHRPKARIFSVASMASVFKAIRASLCRPKDKNWSDTEVSVSHSGTVIAVFWEHRSSSLWMWLRVSLLDRHKCFGWISLPNCTVPHPRYRYLGWSHITGNSEFKWRLKGLKNWQSSSPDRSIQHSVFKCFL
jgi:hypothetical protein